MNVIVSKSLPIKCSEIHIYFLFCEFLHGIFIHCMPICERSSEFRLKFLKISAAVWSASLTNEWNEKLMNRKKVSSLHFSGWNFFNRAWIDCNTIWFLRSKLRIRPRIWKMEIKFSQFRYGFQISTPIIVCTWFLRNLVWIFQATEAVKIKFEIDQKSNSSNLIFITRVFKNQVHVKGRCNYGVDIF